ncbi:MULTISPECIES: hypothetical protein [Aeromonas]|jgi:hypothetical protein|uniref:Lipoprotein n=2 Tax=Aeromonas TaxID=642 RepID=A0AAP6VWR8_9GAMM|nr:MULTISPECIES: hypothetical protein [Aeromonas]MBP8189737.1 hypothetical protein [Aeromonas sp.]AVP92776.1 hypothetical protein C7N77_05920 [Aeromonas rivipollensis]MBP8280867.1 hypothetical protein [Aeromonas sp.]MBP9661882.1 hypothetical protein [Aeromonas sp.]MCE9926781.1 hypothetical protein [Aeromonas media]
MKKCLLIALTALPLVAHAGLMDSLTDSVTSSVTSTAKEMAGTAVDSASNEAIKTALDIKEGGSNKQAIKDKLGAPASTKTEAGLEVWTYDLSALNKVSPMLAETSKTLFKDTEAAQKSVVIKFEGETVKTLNLADKAKA